MNQRIRTKTCKAVFARMLAGLGCMALLLVTSAASASDVEAGVYLGADVGKSTYSYGKASGNDLTTGIKLGYQWNPQIATELSLRSLRFGIEAPFFDTTSYPESSTALSVLASFPIEAQLHFYGRLGVGSSTLHSAKQSIHDQRKTDVVAGLGLSYILSQKWRLNLEVTRLSQTKASLMTLGVQFHF